MLKGISPIISPELLKILMEMGHGDELVIGDCNFPAESMGKRCARQDGQNADVLLDAILQLFPLDEFVDAPVTLMRVAIRAGQIFSPAPEDSVLAAVKVMQRNDYSYIPIVENHRIVGVFSTKTLMRIVAENNSALLSESLKFRDIAGFIRLVEEPMAHYGFINPNTTVEDVSLKFQRSKKGKVRLDMLFITDNGRADGVLQGMVTPVDIL
jgi:L-fucose mutarotase/ribose pyranase (RbsD/FucU family)